MKKNVRHWNQSETQMRADLEICPDIIMSFISLGAYRLRTMIEIQKALGGKLQIYSGSPAMEANIRLIKNSEIQHQPLSNKFHKFGVITQNVPLNRYISCGTLVLDLNPRLVHTWGLLIIRRILRKKTILWGHAFPRAGRGHKTELIRRLMRQMATGIITYTQTQADELSEIHKNLSVGAAPNALYYDEEFGFNSVTQRDSFIYVGRLHQDKKPMLAIQAFEIFSESNSWVRLVIVGDGDELESVKRARVSSAARDRIDIVGHESDYDKLQSLYDSAIASLSPGYVGLSVTQSLSFGVPMIVSQDEDHAPEIEAISVGKNAEFFVTNNVQDFSRVMSDVVENSDLWRARGPGIADDCRKKYSVEIMARGVLSMTGEPV